MLCLCACIDECKNFDRTVSLLTIKAEHYQVLAAERALRMFISGCIPSINTTVVIHTVLFLFYTDEHPLKRLFSTITDIADSVCGSLKRESTRSIAY